MSRVIPEDIPYLTGANDYSANQYKSEIRKRLGNTQVDLFDLIETVISLYGIDIVEGESHGAIIICHKLKKYIHESTLNNILLLVLECKPNFAYALASSKQLIEEFRFYYDTVKGYGVIETK